MTEDKWNEIRQEEVRLYYKRFTPSSQLNSENYKAWRNATMLFIEEMDKATEVYEMENKK